MRLTHEKLYQSKDLARINFGDYLQDLTTNLFYALGGGRSIALRVEAEDIFVTVNTAIPCGLLGHAPAWGQPPGGYTARNGCQDKVFRTKIVKRISVLSAFYLRDG